VNHEKFIEKFWLDHSGLLRQRFRLLVFLGALFMPLFSVVDFFYYPDHWRDFFVFRLAVSIYCAGTFFFARKSLSNKWVIYTGLIAYYLVGLCIIWIIISVDGFSTPYYAGLILVFVGFCSIIPFEAKRLLLHIAGLYFFYLAMIFFFENHQQLKIFIVDNIFMLSTTAISLVAAHSNFKLRVREYTHRRKLDRTGAKLHQYATLLESRVAESEANYATVVNNADEAIFVLEEDVIAFPNPSTAELLGHDQRELNCFNFIDFVLPEDRQAVLDAYLEVAGKDRNVTLDSVKIRRLDRTVLSVMITIVPVEWHGKKALLHFVRDITEKQRLEAELLQAQKMEAVGTLAGGIAHDINNVLQIITGYIQILEARRACEPRGRRCLENIKKAAERAANITRQLLLYSRKVECRPVPLDVNEHIVSVCRLLERTIPRMISINMHLQGDLQRVEADPVQFEQVIMNLAVNARDAMPDGGQLDIKTRNIQVDQDMSREHAGLEPGSYVLLTVSDNGTGMDEETLSRIFDPFFTTKEEGKGTGLGLAIVYGIIRKHGGFIYCRSTIGEGTTFLIFLPAYIGEEETASPAQETAIEDLTGRAETILVVDDEEGILEIEKEMLSMHNYQVLTAASGEEALETFREHEDEVGLVILDLNMPGMGGFQCLVELKTMKPDLKIIIATGYAGDSVVLCELRRNEAGMKKAMRDAAVQR